MYLWNRSRYYDKISKKSHCDSLEILLWYLERFKRIPFSVGYIAALVIDGEHQNGNSALTIVVNVAHRFRVICYKISIHPYWLNFILFCIIVSSALLAAEDPLNPDSRRNEVILQKLTLFVACAMLGLPRRSVEIRRRSCCLSGQSASCRGGVGWHWAPLLFWRLPSCR